MTRDELLNYELQDDNTLYGGVAFQGETLKHFLDECELPYDTPLEKINESLVECGILPIVDLDKQRLETIINNFICYVYEHEECEPLDNVVGVFKEYVGLSDDELGYFGITSEIKHLKGGDLEDEED